MSAPRGSLRAALVCLLRGHQYQPVRGVLAEDPETGRWLPVHDCARCGHQVSFGRRTEPR